MPPGIEQTRVAPKDIPPLEWKVNWWGILGLLCMVSSAFLSVGILYEVLEFLQETGVVEVLPFFG